MYTRSEIYVEITAPAGSEGTVTLSGASLVVPQIIPVKLGEEGKTRETFIVYLPGFYTVEVEMPGFKYEKEIIVSGQR